MPISLMNEAIKFLKTCIDNNVDPAFLADIAKNNHAENIGTFFWLISEHYGQKEVSVFLVVLSARLARKCSENNVDIYDLLEQASEQVREVPVE